MRKIFDFLKAAYVEVDRFWVNSAGWPVQVVGNVVSKESTNEIYVEDVPKQITYFGAPTTIYGFYEKSTNSEFNAFGIDAPDEVYIELNLSEWESRPFSGKGLLLSIEGEGYIVVNLKIDHDSFFGKSRVGLICQRFQDPVLSKYCGSGGSIHLNPGCGGKVNITPGNGKGKNEDSNNCCN